MMDWTPPPPLACSLTLIHAPSPGCSDKIHQPDLWRHSVGSVEPRIFVPDGSFRNTTPYLEEPGAGKPESGKMPIAGLLWIRAFEVMPLVIAAEAVKLAPLWGLHRVSWLRKRCFRVGEWLDGRETVLACNCWILSKKSTLEDPSSGSSARIFVRNARRGSFRQVTQLRGRE